MAGLHGEALSGRRADQQLHGLWLRRGADAGRGSQTSRGRSHPRECDETGGKPQGSEARDVVAGDHDQHRPERLLPDQADADDALQRRELGVVRTDHQRRNRELIPSLSRREKTRMAFPRASTALSRFTVLDLTRVRAGPTAVRQLADWGANVVKIEMPEHLDGADPMGGPRHGLDFQNLHRNKRSITLNLKAAAGVTVLRRLVEQADVVVENYRPDVKARLGIDYPALRQVNPRIVYASISGFGQSGPYRDR